jgi:polyisoprenoid-binding protein YceI
MKVFSLGISGLVTVFSLVLIPLTVSASTWQIDPDHTSIQFKVRHLMVSNVKGVFHKFNGTVDMDDKDITRSRAVVTIDTNSIDTGVVKRDEDLRSDHFFEVAKFPTMTFVSKKIMRNGADKLKVTGDLTIHGITREVLLNVEGPSAAVRDPWGGTRIGATAVTRIDRKDFGLTWNKVLETGGVVVGDEVEITLEVELVRK